MRGRQPGPVAAAATGLANIKNAFEPWDTDAELDHAAGEGEPEGDGTETTPQGNLASEPEQRVVLVARVARARRA